nr:hypothetical protein [Angustibacter aerolatus]
MPSAGSQVWLTLAMAIIGGGAMFATFAYIAPMMTKVAGFSESAVTPLLVLFGIGMTAGNVVGARLADRSMMQAIYLALGAEAVVAALFFLTARNQVTAAITVLLFPFAAMMMIPSVQSRLVGLAGGAPTWPPPRCTRRSTSPTRSAPRSGSGHHRGCRLAREPTPASTSPPPASPSSAWPSPCSPAPSPPAPAVAPPRPRCPSASAEPVERGGGRTPPSTTLRPTGCGAGW